MIDLLLVHPAVAYALGALLVLALPARARTAALLAAPAAALLMVERLAAAGDATAIALPYLDLALEPIRADALGLLFARIFAIAGAIAMLYGLRERDSLTHAAAMVTVGAGIGVVLAGDLITLLVAWELKAIATTVVVITGRQAGSVRAAHRYFLVHAFGGGVLLVGVALWATEHGITFDAMPLDGASAWILAGFALGAAIPPLHAWLTEAYPEASPFGMVVLSAFTTKASVYALIRGFPGVELLVWVGAAMALYGAMFAVLENDIRRLLAYHIVSQVGFMVCGVGMGATTDVGRLALDGSSAHAASHILYKGLLLMAAGAVVYATGKRKLTELGGLWRHMPVTLVLCMVGAFSISGVPLFNGFVSKSMVVTAAELDHRAVIELMLVTASIGTFLHTGLKLPWFVFFGEDRGVRPSRPVPWNMTAAMVVAAVLCTAIGVAPERLYALLPFGADYEPYTFPHVIHALQLLLGTAIGFFLLLPLLAGKRVALRDAGDLYRVVGRTVVRFSRDLLVPALDRAADMTRRAARGTPHLGTRIQSVSRRPVGFWVAIVAGALAALILAL